MPILIVTVKSDAQQRAAYEIREEVFVREQLVPLELERDAFDARAHHILALIADTASSSAVNEGETFLGSAVTVGTARAFQNPECVEEVVLGRLAVLKPYRRLGVGGAMIAWFIKRARADRYKRIRLHAQSYIIGLYARFGFFQQGDEFVEAGIPHREMILEL